MSSETVKPGKYLHFKGNTYEVLGVALEVTNGQPEVQKVVYRNASGSLFVRTVEEFTEEVTWPDGSVKPRWVLVQILETFSWTTPPTSSWETAAGNDPLSLQGITVLKCPTEIPDEVRKEAQLRLKRLIQPYTVRKLYAA